MSASKPPSHRRRDLFRSAVAEVDSVANEFRGVPQLFLDKLPELPEEKLRQVIPAVRQEVRLRYENGCVVASFQESDAEVELFASNSRELRIFNLFDGSRSLVEIGEIIEQQPIQSPKLHSGYQHAKDLFLQLVDCGICVPVNAIY